MGGVKFGSKGHRLAGAISDQIMSKIIPYINRAHPGGGHNYSETCRGYHPFFKVVAKADFPGNHQTAQTPFSKIVSGGDILHSGEESYSLPVFQYRSGLVFPFFYKLISFNSRLIQ